MLLLDKMHKVVLLAIGAHPDDIELGAGGIISYLCRKYGAVVHMAILTSGMQRGNALRSFKRNQRKREAIDAAEVLLGRVVDAHPKKHVHFANLIDCELCNAGHRPIRFLENLIDIVKPDIILTHAPEDTHDDHRQTYHATLSAARNFCGTMLLYQAPSTRFNGFNPNWFFKLDDEDFMNKLVALKQHSSQRNKQFMSYHQIAKVANVWPSLRQLPDGHKFEAFSLYQSFVNIT